VYLKYKKVNKTPFYNKIWLEFGKPACHIKDANVNYLVGLGLVAADAMTPRLVVDPTNAAFV